MGAHVPPCEAGQRPESVPRSLWCWCLHEPGRKSGAFVVAGEDLSVGLLGLQRGVEALGFAVMPRAPANR